ncbi:MAG: riboflavin synthase [Candidatus Caenarcaniphilales bacterium]|nr:riboflavin synthase [Candidatus Caenarcaniphilales bacterium]
MFTGIVEATGQLLKKEELESGDMRWVVSLRGLIDWESLKIGESISLNGACHTLERLEGSDGLFFSSLETLSKTSLSRWQPGIRVNLERPVSLQDRLGGHLVSGHIDGTAELIKIEEQGDGFWLELKLDESFDPLVISKGSVALDGISLTVAKIWERSPSLRFAVAIIPHTWKTTNLSTLKVGDWLNFEADQIAKYVIQYAEQYHRTEE